MNKNIFNELWTKAFRSGNPLFLFIGINILVFLVLNVFNLFVTLNLIPTSLAIQHSILPWLQLPANIGSAVWKPWTILTYMFTQVSFFHLLFNMLWLYWMGTIFMSFLSKKQFQSVYLIGGFAGATLYLLAYNLIPFFAETNTAYVLIGSSACVSAVVFAAATLVPDYTIRMLFFGNVKLKYLALAFIILDLLGVGGGNAGGSIAHIGGALSGFIFIRQLQKGNDWSKLFNKSKKSKLRVVSNKRTTSETPKQKAEESSEPNQEMIDRILDKISLKGYDSLTKEEKEALFKMSKQDQR